MSTSERYRRFAQGEAHGKSPAYERLSLGIAEDPEILALVERLPEPKQQPNLILGAARHLGAPTGSYRSFRGWILDHWPAVERTARTRSTQTNESGRTAVLLPVLAMLDGPLALVEVGAAAGLCLYPDRYSYRYDGQPDLDPEDGPSPVLLTCTTSGTPPLPRKLPTVVHRAGIDLAPLDVNNTDDLAWLDSLVWPEHHGRRDRLQAAAAIARRDRPQLVRGDLTAALADVVRQAPPAATVVVFHSAVLNYVDAAARAVFARTVRALPCHWISNEGPRVLPEITGRLPMSPEQVGGRFVVALDGEPLALAGAHGQSLDWLRRG